jgi:hypothetical protein
MKKLYTAKEEKLKSLVSSIVADMRDPLKNSMGTVGAECWKKMSDYKATRRVVEYVLGI